MQLYERIVEPVKAMQLRVADEEFPPGFVPFRLPIDGRVGCVITAAGTLVMFDREWVVYDAVTEKPLNVVAEREFEKRFREKVVSD